MTLQSHARRCTVAEDSGKDSDLEVDSRVGGDALDEAVGHSLLATASVVRARWPGQRLERVAHGGATDRVEKPADQDATVRTSADTHRALLCELLLVVVVGLRVQRVPVVHDLLKELARRELLRQWQELVLVKDLADRLGGPTHGGQVGVTDLATFHGLDAL